ncbi:hypothetical protein [Streptomyces avermitilis]|uniref:hypothetical protein n=1 Tax=Streptomyces avermitilis TaxID=33903 RepID=UPI003815CA1B
MSQLTQALEVAEVVNFVEYRQGLVQVCDAAAQDSVALWVQSATVVLPGGDTPGDASVKQHHVDACALGTAQASGEGRAQVLLPQAGHNGFVLSRAVHATHLRAVIFTAALVACSSSDK